MPHTIRYNTCPTCDGPKSTRHERCAACRTAGRRLLPAPCPLCGATIAIRSAGCAWCDAASYLRKRVPKIPPQAPQPSPEPDPLGTHAICHQCGRITKIPSVISEATGTVTVTACNRCTVRWDVPPPRTEQAWLVVIAAIPLVESESDSDASTWDVRPRKPDGSRTPNRSCGTRARQRIRTGVA